MTFKVFITTNEKQRLGALLSRYTIEKYTKHSDKFEISTIEVEKVPEIRMLFGKSYLRDGRETNFDSANLQSFTLTRFMPPELMNYEGRSVVLDPDVFATYSDIWELLSMDMGEAAIMCRKQKSDVWGSSVMLLDNTKLKHWSIRQIVQNLLSLSLDYKDVMSLVNEKAPIAELSKDWNSFDELNASTKLLHNTQRNTQPWRAGLKLDYQPKPMKPLFGVLRREWVHTLLGKNPNRHREHPDKRQTDFFFGQLKSAMLEGRISRTDVELEVARKHVRPDALSLVETVAPL